MRFFAQADREVNQDAAPFVPFGWGPTLLDALSECLKGVRQFPYRAGAAPAPSGPPGPPEMALTGPARGAISVADMLRK